LAVEAASFTSPPTGLRVLDGKISEL